MTNPETNRGSGTICLLLTFFFFCTIPPAQAQSGSGKDLFSALQENDSARVQELLNQGADPNATDADGDNALMISALYSSATCMDLLLQKGADPNKTNLAGETALMWSVHELSKTRLLLNHGAEVNIKSGKGNTALLIAVVGRNQQEIIALLLERGADPLAKNNFAETTLHRSAFMGDTSRLALFFSKGVDINARDSAGFTALIQSAIHSNWNCSQWLLSHGADPDLAMAFGITALAAAGTYGSYPTVQALLRQVKNVNAIYADGHTPLMWAVYCEHDNPEVIQALLAKGAKVNFHAKDGSTALSGPEKKETLKRLPY